METGKIVESDNMDDNAKTLVSNKIPDVLDGDYGRSKPDYQGAIKTLHDRWIRITLYTETGGDGKPLKKSRWI